MTTTRLLDELTESRAFMMLRQTVVFPEAVPPATPIKNGPRETPLAEATCLFDGEGLEGGVNGGLSSSPFTSISMAS